MSQGLRLVSINQASTVIFLSFFLSFERYWSMEGEWVAMRFECVVLKLKKKSFFLSPPRKENEVCSFTTLRWDKKENLSLGKVRSSVQYGLLFRMHASLPPMLLPKSLRSHLCFGPLPVADDVGPSSSSSSSTFVNYGFGDDLLPSRIFTAEWWGADYCSSSCGRCVLASERDDRMTQNRGRSDPHTAQSSEFLMKKQHVVLLSRSSALKRERKSAAESEARRKEAGGDIH